LKVAASETLKASPQSARLVNFVALCAYRLHDRELAKQAAEMLKGDFDPRVWHYTELIANFKQWQAFDPPSVAPLQRIWMDPAAASLQRGAVFANSTYAVPRTALNRLLEVDRDDNRVEVVAETEPNESPSFHVAGEGDHLLKIDHGWQKDEKPRISILQPREKISIEAEQVTGTVAAVQFVDGGKRFVACIHEQYVGVWNVETGKRLRVLEGLEKLPMNSFVQIFSNGESERVLVEVKQKTMEGAFKVAYTIHDVQTGKRIVKVNLEEILAKIKGAAGCHPLAFDGGKNVIFQAQYSDKGNGNLQQVKVDLTQLTWEVVSKLGFSGYYSQDLTVYAVRDARTDKVTNARRRAMGVGDDRAFGKDLRIWISLCDLETESTLDVMEVSQDVSYRLSRDAKELQISSRGCLYVFDVETLKKQMQNQPKP
jgi:hypothetical protein